MTVGAGSTSESAARLQAILDEDSGYGGSMTGDENAWHPGPSQDRFTPAHTPMGAGDSNASEHEKKALASHVHQLFYNQNRTALGRAINQTVETMKKLQEINAKWPAHYPTVQRPPSPPANRAMPRPGLVHTQSTMDNQRGVEESTREHEDLPRPGMMRRANTSLASPESSGDAAKR